MKLLDVTCLECGGAFRISQSGTLPLHSHPSKSYQCGGSWSRKFSERPKIRSGEQSEFPPTNRTPSVKKV